MSSLVGFTVFSNLPEDSLRALQAAHDSALAHFALQRHSLVLGETHLELWGRTGMEERLHTLPDGSLTVLIGSPHGEVHLADVQDDLLAGKFEIPWDGRVIMLHVSADGKRWTMWNDWLGSIPVFHSQLGQGRIASTLEPVVVAAGGFTPDDFFLPGLLFLLIHGNFIGDWTLYAPMKVTPPDSLCEWDRDGFRSRHLSTVMPTDARWESGWDDLIDEMHELSRQAISDVLKTQAGWILPLSSGLDSRLIAGVGAELGVNLCAFCWGKRDSIEAVYSHEIARALGIPWKWIDIGTDYLVRYAPLWADMFGSAMHFHGMYQMPFYDGLRSELPDPIVSGFLGDTLAGYDVHFQSQFHSSLERPYQTQPDGYTNWSPQDLRRLFKHSIDDALEQVADEITRQRSAVPGPGFQSLRFLTLWGRQRHFTYFQSMLCDYWRGVSTPYLNRNYARFCLSLPRAVLEERRLEGDVFRRYYGILATIPGSYEGSPLISTGRHLLNRRISRFLPETLLHGPFQEFNPSQPSTDVDCVRAGGWKSFWPIPISRDRLQELLNLDEIEKVYNSALDGDQKSVRKLQSVQTLAYRLLDRGSTP